MGLLRRCFAELFGTFWLVLGGCGSAVLAAGFPQLGIGFAGVALAFGLTVLTMAYAVGSISGGHFNPAVTLGLVTGRRFPLRDLPAYVVSQVGGAVAAAGVLFLIASGKPGFSTAGGFAPMALACTLRAAIRSWPASSWKSSSRCFSCSSLWDRRISAFPMVSHRLR